jgi:hypothetical protein
MIILLPPTILKDQGKLIILGDTTPQRRKTEQATTTKLWMLKIRQMSDN